MGNMESRGIHALKAPWLRFFDNQLIDFKALHFEEDLGAKVDLVQRTGFPSTIVRQRLCTAV